MADAAKAARAAALEEKRRRLEELRQRRQRRADPSTPARTSRNLNEYIDGLLAAPAATLANQEEKTESTDSGGANNDGSTDDGGTANGTANVGNNNNNNNSSGGVINNNNNTDNVIAEQAAPTTAAPAVKKVVTFEVSTQTDTEDFPLAPAGQDDEEEGDEDGQAAGAEANKADEDQAQADEDKPENGALPEPKLLSDKEKEEAVASVPFSSFLNTASKKVERVLGTPVLADLLVDFVGETGGEETTDKPTDTSRFVAVQEEFTSPKWTGTRDVTDMDWSPLHRELYLSSYHMPSTSIYSSSAALTAISPDDTPSASVAPRSGELQSDGLTLVWNIAMPSRPEHIFTCGSPVLKSKFHPSESTLVIGACQSGQLVIWDVRAGRLPVQRSNQAHSHPICGMEIQEQGVRAGCISYIKRGGVLCVPCLCSLFASGHVDFVVCVAVAVAM